MKVKLVCQNFIVMDEFLPTDAFAALWKAFQSESFQSINTAGWNKVWGLTDGHGREGPSYLSDLTLAQKLKSPLPPLAYQTFIAELKALTDLVEQKFGWSRSVFDVFTLRSFIYPPDCGLAWHDDGKGRHGAFTIYVNQTWHPAWGGELLLDSGSEPSADQSTLAPFDNPHLIKQLAGSLGTYVFPWPNRLVLLKSGTLHTIQQVDAAAGHHARCSLTGFFLEESTVAKLRG